jgi:hypothetical protein
MQRKKLAWAVPVLLLAVGLTSCNIGKTPGPAADVNAIYTSAAGTMIAELNVQQTQTAQAIPPLPLASPTALATFTPLPTFPIAPGTTPFGIAGTPFLLNTPIGGLTPLASLPPGAFSNPVGCDDAMLVGETVPDGTKVDAFAVFKKSWNFVNTGTCTWDEGYSFAFKSGDRLQGVDVRFRFDNDFVKPGKGTAFTIELTAPGHIKEYKGYWQMKNDHGQWFGSLVWVDIVVKKSD